MILDETTREVIIAVMDRAPWLNTAEKQVLDELKKDESITTTLEMIASKLPEREEFEVGNCAIWNIILNLQKGWTIKEMLYRGFVHPYGCQCEVTPITNPNVAAMTRNYLWKAGDEIPKVSTEFLAGFNKVVFIRPKLDVKVGKK
jgi:hypothetical protein